MSGPEEHPPSPHNPLELALIAAATEPAARPLFYRLVLESALLVLDDNPDREGQFAGQIVEAGHQLRVATLDIEGVPHIPIFSSKARVAAVVDSERRYVSMLGRSLLEVLRGSHLILNPGSDCGKQFLPDEVEALLSGALHEGHREIKVAASTEVLLGQPADYPRHLTEALSTLFRDLPVQAAYLAHCLWPTTGEPAHTVIGITTDADWEPLIRKVMATIGRAAREGEVVDVVRMDDSAIPRYMRSTAPFFKKKRFLFF
jgi:SseB protein C-terminal domain/SseB protein N-terminal domain